jgi:succinate dehydrogenase/fumarate reductase-like Fe-S protein
MENLKAKIFLAFHLLRHIVVLIRRAFGHRDSGLKKFHDNYAVEQPLWSPTPEERAQFSNFSQCINCGICEADCAVLHRGEVKNFKPSWIPLAFRYTP